MTTEATTTPETTETTETTETKGPKFTSATRRGLRDVRALVLDSFDDRKPGSTAQTATWTAKRRREFNQALDWIDAKTTSLGE